MEQWQNSFLHSLVLSLEPQVIQGKEDKEERLSHISSKVFLLLWIFTSIHPNKSSHFFLFDPFTFKKRPGCKHTIQWQRETPERKEATVVFYLTARNNSFSLGASRSAKQSTKTAITLSVPTLNLELQIPAQCWPCLSSPWIFSVFLTEDPRRLDHLYSEFVRSRRRNELLPAKWMVLWFSVLQPNPPRHSSKLENMSTDCFLFLREVELITIFKRTSRLKAYKTQYYLA